MIPPPVPPKKPSINNDEDDPFAPIGANPMDSEIEPNEHRKSAMSAAQELIPQVFNDNNDDAVDTQESIHAEWMEMK